MRERGLKHWMRNYKVGIDKSLPMRERGLKPMIKVTALMSAMSLPMRERGLKHHQLAHMGNFVFVAPHAGAWIETS